MYTRPIIVSSRPLVDYMMSSSYHGAMEETRATTYALWGLGELSPENAKALLDEYIAENVGAVYRPERVTREHQGLRTALAWFEAPEFLGDGGAMPSTDLVASLLNEREDNGDEVYLLALWPEVPTHEDFNFIEAAQRDGITVLDLSRAMDELDLTLYSRPEPTKEEKAEARAVARAAAKAEKEANKPPAKTSAKKKLSDDAGDPSDTDTVITVGVTRPNVPVYDFVEEEARLWMEVEMAKALLDQAIKNYTETITVAMIPIREDIEAREDRPPFNADEVPPFLGEEESTSFYWSPANGYRLAEGKPRRGESVRILTPEQIKELRLNV